MTVANNIKKRVSKITGNAYVYSVIAKIISVLTGLIYSVLYSRYMQPSLRGTASIITNYAELIMLVLCFGIYQGYPYFKRKTNKDIYGEYINLISGLFLLYISIFVFITFLFHPETNTIVVMALIPLMFATKELNYVALIENPKLRNTAQIWLDIFDIAFVLILMLFTKSNFNLCVAFIITREAVFFLIAVINLKYNILKIRPSLKDAAKYISFGFVPMITVIMMEVNYKSDVLMLEYFNVDKAEIGIYTLGVSLAQKVWLIPDALKDILLSKLAKGKDENEVKKSQE